MDSDNTVDPAPRVEFQSTQWSLVMTAQHRSSPEGRLAFEKLCGDYWYPLFAFARRREADAHRARDLIQEFFLKVIEKNYLADVDPQRGRFRTFLITSFLNFMSNERDKETTQKRGGAHKQLPLDLDWGETRYLNEPADALTPERHYERLWGQTLLRNVLQQLRSEYVDKAELFEQLQQYLTPSPAEKYSVVAARMNMSEGAVKVAVHRLKGRYRDLLRREITRTVATEDEVEDEIGRLFAAFAP